MYLDHERGMYRNTKVTSRELLHAWNMDLIYENGHNAADKLRHHIRTTLPPDHPLIGFKYGPSELSTRLEIEVSERAEYLRLCIEEADRLIQRADTTAEWIDVTAESVNDVGVRKQVFISAETARRIAHQARQCKAKLVPLLAKMQEVLDEWRKWRGQNHESDDTSSQARPLIDRFSARSGLQIAIEYLKRRRWAPIAPPQPSGMYGRNYGQPVTSWKRPMIAHDGRGSGAPPLHMW